MIPSADERTSIVTIITIPVPDVASPIAPPVTLEKNPGAGSGTTTGSPSCMLLGVLDSSVEYTMQDCVCPSFNSSKLTPCEHLTSSHSKQLLFCSQLSQTLHSVHKVQLYAVLQLPPPDDVITLGLTVTNKVS